MLTAVSQPELDVRAIEDLVKGEASLCYRLLCYLNSAVFGFAAEIHTVRHALAILGEREVRRWIRLVAALGAGQGKSSDLVLCWLLWFALASANCSRQRFNARTLTCF